MTPAPDDPLILTAMLDPASQAHFDRLRERYFPPSINYLRAHVTMFHHLPGEHATDVEAAIAAACGEMGPVPFTVTGLRFLGRGTAYALSMPAVADLRRRLARTWAGRLTRQDQQPWQPHVTVQNKVAPAEARRLHDTLMAGFSPFAGVVAGVRLWAYRGGPWDLLAERAFTQTIVETRS